MEGDIIAGKESNFSASEKDIKTEVTPYTYLNKSYIVEIEYNENGSSIRDNFRTIIASLVERE